MRALIIENLFCFPPLYCLCIATALAERLQPSLASSLLKQSTMVKHQVIRTSSYFIISWLPIMPSIHLDAKCWPIHLGYLESHIKIISLCDAFPFKESVITLLLAISSSMISYFCSIMANYQAIYLFLLFQMLHYGPAIPVVFQVLWRLAIPCFSPSFKGHFISGQAPSLPSGL